MSITWNGVSSDTIGVIVERIPNRYVPTRRFSPQQVAGRNGNILLVDKAFPNVEQEYEVYLSAEAQGLPSVARACAEWLMGPDGYCRLEDSYDTTVYREAFLMGGYDLENILNKFGRCTISFSCKPQKYLLTGDTPIEIPAGITTYTGDVVQFDGVTGASITSLSTTITPTQDLHGYSSPWPAGGGKNKLPNNASTATVQSATYTVNADGTITVNGKSTGWTGLTIASSFTLPAGSYVLESLVDEGNTFNYYLELTQNGTFIANTNRDANKAFTLSEESTLACKLYARPSYQLTNVTCYPMILLSTETNLSYAPYSNICPISGRTGLSVYKTGKNLFDQSDTTYLAQDARSYGSSDNRALAQINTLPAGTYTLSFSEKIVSLNGIEAVSTRFGLYLRATNDGHTFNVNAQSELITPTVGQIITKTVTFTLTDEYVGKFQYFYVYTGKNDSHGAPNEYTANIYDVQIELGSATAYEPYNGNTYSVDWTTQAGTVYGGTLDVVTGVLTVDKVLYTYTGNESVSARSGNYIPVKLGASGIYVTNDGICTDFEHVLVSANGWSYIQTTMTPAEMQTYLQNHTVSIVCELAAPLTYQLTAQEIGVLVGENNVWTSSGPVSVTVEAPFVGTVTNPTPFEARPLLTVSGVGEITINGKSIQILESVSDFEIDCETMEAEDNSKIYCMDFPDLSGGENEIAGDGSITALTVTPRWWTL